MSTADLADIGRLLTWAARPREKPANRDEYHRLITRYRDDADFSAAVDAVFAGAGLDIHVDERDGAVVVAASDSPLRLTLSDVMRRASDNHRAIIGLAVLAVARTAYPEPAMIDDADRVAVFTTQDVVDTLDRAAQAWADGSNEDGPIDDTAVEMWRRWLLVNPARPNAQRRSASDRPGVVNKVCRFLTDAGYLTSRGDTDGGTWLARPRFRYAVAALCEDSELYAELNGLTDAAPVANTSERAGS